MKTRTKMIRILAALLFLAAAVAAADTGGAAAIGTLCVLCPVGFAQVAAASQSIPWHLLPGVLAVLLVVLLAGRAFCAWVCPSQLLKNIFGGRTPRGILGRSGEDRVLASPQASGGAGKAAGCAACAEDGSNLKTQGIVLAVLLAVSFAVKFPVFCLLCPIGLVFGTLWALNRVFVLLQPGWELVVFPLMLLAELFLFKRWCSAICPLGFFFGLMAKLRAKLGFGLRPQANCATCISHEGCRTCSTVCPENINVANPQTETLESCTFCLDCVENCPNGLVSSRPARGKTRTRGSSPMSKILAGCQGNHDQHDEQVDLENGEEHAAGQAVEPPVLGCPGIFLAPSCPQRALRPWTLDHTTTQMQGTTMPAMPAATKASDTAPADGPPAASTNEEAASAAREPQQQSMTTPMRRPRAR